MSTNQEDKAEVEALRIVIAEDEPLIRMDLRRTLENMGHVVIGEAGDGAKAVELARETRPDICILDIKMPEMDGIDAAKVISTEGIAPVLLLTAYSQKDLVERARDAGVFAYLVKPFKETDLMPAIDIAIARYEEFLELESEVSKTGRQVGNPQGRGPRQGHLMDQYQLKEQDAFRPHPDPEHEHPQSHARDRRGHHHRQLGVVSFPCASR
jgi:response regulator NasT